MMYYSVNDTGILGKRKSECSVPGLLGLVGAKVHGTNILHTAWIEGALRFSFPEYACVIY